MRAAIPLLEWSIVKPGPAHSGLGELRVRPLVLVIDDEPQIADLFSRLLCSGGFSTVEARSAEDALTLLGQGLAPDAILLDLLMPGMGGLAFLRRLRDDPRHKTLPVTVVTAHCFVDPSVQASVAALGATITFKPVDHHELLLLVTAMLARSDGDTGAPDRSR